MLIVAAYGFVTKQNQRIQPCLFNLIAVVLNAATYGNYSVVRADYPPWFISANDPDSVMYDFAVVALESPAIIPGRTDNLDLPFKSETTYIQKYMAKELLKQLHLITPDIPADS